MFQQCPACNGTGYDPNITGAVNIAYNCTVCHGKRIIDTQTGEPPK